MPPVHADRIYKLLTSEHWQQMRTHGQFDGSPDDQRDGFIHLSLGSQLESTLARHYVQIAEVMLLEIDANCVGAALRLEPSRGGALFPHLYAPLPMTACRPIAWRRRPHGEWQPLQLL